MNTLILGIANLLPGDAGVGVHPARLLEGQGPLAASWLIPRIASDFPQRLAAHDLGLRNLQESFDPTGDAPGVVLYAVSIDLPDDMTTAFSPPASAALPGLAAAVLAEVRDRGRGGNWSHRKK